MSLEPFYLYYHSVLIRLKCFSVMIHVHCNSQEASMRAKHFVFNNSRILGDDLVCVGFLFGPCFVIQLFSTLCPASFAIILMGNR